VYAGGQWRTLESPEGLDRPAAVSLAADSAGHVWAGYQGAVARYTPDGKLDRLYTAADGLPSDAEHAPVFSAVYVDRAGTVWAADDMGHVACCVGCAP